MPFNTVLQACDPAYLKEYFFTFSVFVTIIMREGGREDIVPQQYCALYES